MRRRRDERGAAAVLFALVSLSLMLIAGLVVDLGFVRDQTIRAQVSADSAALAGANAMYPNAAVLNVDYNAAVKAAKAYAAENFGTQESDWTTCKDPKKLVTVPAGSTECISFKVDYDFAEIRVKIPVKKINTGFTKLFGGRQNHEIAASANAKQVAGGGFRCGLCVLGSGLHNIQNGLVDVKGADVHFNGDPQVYANGKITSDGKITYEGTQYGVYSSYSPMPIDTNQRMTDPMQNFAYPTAAELGLTAKTTTDICSGGPGIYQGAINTRNKRCNLTPGVYMFVAGSDTPTTNPTIFDLAGNSGTQITGTGVTFYFTCGTINRPRACNNELGAQLDLSGNGSVVISAPTSGPTAGIAYLYDRSNTSPLRLTGNALLQFTGTTYAPKSELVYTGNGCVDAYRSLFIVENMSVGGNNPCFRSHYSLTENYVRPAFGLHISN